MLAFPDVETSLVTCNFFFKKKKKEVEATFLEVDLRSLSLVSTSAEGDGEVWDYIPLTLYRWDLYSVHHCKGQSVKLYTLRNAIFG
jgi:hypothetical protein